MKKYLVRVNCPNFKDVEVEAENEEDAKREAEKHFNCDAARGEFEQFLSTL